MVKYFVKKWLVGQINNLLEQYKDNVDKVREILDKWIIRMQKILEALNKINTRLDDNKIDDEEIDNSVDDIEQLIKEW